MLLIQLTGLSGAGKTSVANALKELCIEKGISIEIIDGDVYRKTLCKDLGFSKEDRCENIRRLGTVANVLCKHKDVVVIAAINPYAEARSELVKKYGAKTVWISCNLKTLLLRGTKGLYKKAFLPHGHPDKIYNLTGVSDVYETPYDADLIIHTDTEALPVSANTLFNFVQSTFEPLKTSAPPTVGIV